MYCPNCGKTNSTEQKFCRGCGLALEDVVQSLVIQKRDSLEFSLKGKTKLVEKAITILGCLGLSTFVIAIIGMIVYWVIIQQANVWGGIAFIAFILLAASMLVLIVYRESLLEEAKKNPNVQDISVEDEDPLQIAASQFEPVRSVTEQTTNLLTMDRRKYKTRELD